MKNSKNTIVALSVLLQKFVLAVTIYDNLRKRILAGSGIIDFAVGNAHTCALDISKAIFCWGDEESPALGYGDEIARYDASQLTVPVNIGSNRVVKSIHAGAENTCVILESDDLICWGSNDSGQLGIGSSEIEDIGSTAEDMGDTLSIVNLGSGRKMKHLAMKGSHICSILDNDKLKCWGNNENHQLGYGDTDNRGDDADEMGDKLPYVGNGLTVKDVQLGEKHTCILLFIDEVKCWGSGDNGRLGYGNSNEQIFSDSLPAVDVGGAVEKIFVGFDLSCALLTGSGVKCWGNNEFGQLGYNDSNNRGENLNEMGNNLPLLDFGTGETVKALTGGLLHQCALLNSNKLKCFGNNESCELGNGNTNVQSGALGDQLPFVDVGSREVKEVESLEFTTCIKFLDDTMSCFGKNDNAQLGVGDSSSIGCSPTDMGNNLVSLRIGNNGMSEKPSLIPSIADSNVPSTSPSMSLNPSYLPSLSRSPSFTPSYPPSFIPSKIPSFSPSSPYECQDNNISIEITTDINPIYTNWCLNSMNNGFTVMKVGHGYYKKRDTKYLNQYCFQTGAFEFSLSHPLPEWHGEYKISLNDRSLLQGRPDGYFQEIKKTISFCSADSHCNDKDICTIDTCDLGTNECKFTPQFSASCRSKGEPKTLILRVTSSDSPATASRGELHESYFGAADYSLTSQILHCSYDVLKIIPFSGLTITNENISDGIVDVELDMEIIGQSVSSVVDETINRADALLGSLSSQFSFVAICIPYGTFIGASASWVAYAFINSYISIYNGEGCLYPSVQMHELGHNIGLSHSNDFFNYGDTTGAMGLSTPSKNGPLKCFNAPKSFELGWYTGGYLVLDIKDILMTEIELVGISDYEARHFRSTHVKIINCQNGFDYYVSFNRDTKMNVGTGEGQNNVLISRRSIGNYYDDSTLIAKLSHLQKFTIYALGPEADWNIQIIPNIFMSKEPAYARISFLQWSSYCSNAKSCDDNNRCTIDSCSNDADTPGCINLPVNICHECGSSLVLEVLTNDSPEELTWELQNYNTQKIVKSSVSHTAKESIYTYRDCFEYGTYKFSIYYADNSTASNISSSFNLTVGDVLIDQGVISDIIFSELIFTICSIDEDCYDYDGCSIDYCDKDTRLCNNTFLETTNCSGCTWITIEIVPDNYEEETSWNIKDDGTDSVVIAGDPQIIYTPAFERWKFSSKPDRRKVPTKSGRRKAPTRAAGSYLLQNNYDNDIRETICLENNIKYHFIIKDTFGDGLCCSEGMGSYAIGVGESIIQAGGDFSKYEELFFKFSDSQASCEDNDLGTRKFYDPVNSVCLYSDVPCEEYGALVTIEIKSDIYADDTSWKITGRNKTVISEDTHEMAFTSYEKEECISFGLYSFTIFDSQENGMAYCFDHVCGYKVDVNNETVIISDGSFGALRSHTFGICLSDEYCDDGDPCTLDACDVAKKICTFTKLCSLCNKTSVTTIIKTDELFSLTSWEILNLENHSTIQTGGPYVTSYHEYNETFCFSTGNYLFVMKNSEGRGIAFCDTGNCGFEVFVEDHPAIVHDGSFSYESQNIFGICLHDFECFDGDECTKDTCNKETYTCIFEQLPCSACNKQNITVIVTTDLHGKETSYTLSSTGNKTTNFERGPFPQKYKPYQQTYCLDDESYIFTIHDSLGDGLSDCKTYDQNCGYSLIVNDFPKIQSDGSFLRNASHFISFCNNDADCKDYDRNRCSIDSCDVESNTCKYKTACWECSQNTFTIDLVTDEIGGNTAWYLTQNELLISAGGVYARKESLYREEACVPFGKFDFEVLHRKSSNASSLSNAANPGFKAKLNGVLFIESEGFESKSYTVGKPVEDWFIDYISADFVSDREVSLKYFVSKNLNVEQLIASIYDKSCSIKLSHPSVTVSNTSLTVQNKETVDKGIFHVALDYPLMKDTVFWNRRNTDSALVRFCVKAELLLDEDSSLSVSFVDTKVDILISFDTETIIGDAKLLTADAAELKHEKETEILSCVCDNSLKCFDQPQVFPNSAVKFCIQVSNNDIMQINRIESLDFYQDGALVHSPIKMGKFNELTSKNTYGAITVVKTQLLASIFESPDPSHLYVTGEVLLGLKRKLLLQQQKDRRLKEESLSKFHLLISISKPPNHNIFYIVRNCILMAWCISFLIYYRKKDKESYLYESLRYEG